MRYRIAQQQTRPKQMPYIMIEDNPTPKYFNVDSSQPNTERAHDLVSTNTSNIISNNISSAKVFNHTFN